MWRLVCARRAGACALYDLRTDPAETHDVSTVNAERFQAMKTALRRIEATQGHYEATGASDAGDRPWPGPIRRGLAGDGEAAAEIAELLDDSDIRFRRKAAELLFDLKRKEGAAPLRLSVARDDDTTVRRWAALALARLGESSDLVVDLLNGPDREARRLAALALGENGDVRAGPVLVEWWQAERLPYARAREVLAALAEIRPKEAASPLIASLGDLRLRPYIAQTLASIGQPAARAPLAERLATERRKDTRAALAAALLKLGAKSELAPPLIRFLGTPDPLPDGVDMARRSGLLPLVGTTEEDLARLGAAGDTPVSIKFPTRPRTGGATTLPSGAAGYRLLARGASTDGKPGRMTFTSCPTAGRALGPAVHRNAPLAAADGAAADGAERATLDFADGSPRELFFTLPFWLVSKGPDICVTVERTANLTVEGIAIVPLADELPPPPPEPWEALPTSPFSGAPSEASSAASH
jgi:hypothetical protein